MVSFLSLPFFISLSLPPFAPSWLLLFFLPSFTEFVKKYATEEALKEQDDDSSSEESSMSDFSDDETKAMEI